MGATPKERKRLKRQFDSLPAIYIYHWESCHCPLTEEEINQIEKQINKQEAIDVKLEQKFLHGKTADERDGALFRLVARDIDYWKEWPIQMRINEWYDSWINATGKKKKTVKAKLDRLGILKPNLKRRRRKITDRKADKVVEYYDKLLKWAQACREDHETNCLQLACDNHMKCQTLPEQKLPECAARKEMIRRAFEEAIESEIAELVMDQPWILQLSFHNLRNVWKDPPYKYATEKTIRKFSISERTLKSML
jgi:hypothetical protein